MNTIKEGTVYTPESIADYVALTSIKNFFYEKLNKEFSKELLNLNYLFENLIQKEPNSQFSVNSIVIYYDKGQAEFIFKVIKNLTILDPAVGKGQFLCAAFKVLEKGYLNLKILGVINWSLCKIRKYIITHNLFGVDIDYEAIKSAKKRFSNTLKNLELNRKGDKRLQTLKSNLRVGNALIGLVNQSENMDQQLSSHNKNFYKKIKCIFQSHKDLKNIMLSDAEIRVMIAKLKPFHWFLEFPKIMKNGGFDIIIENPPYISNKQLSPLEKAIFQKIYETPKGLMNTFGIFIERSIDLCHPLSRISFIVHKNIIRSNNYDLLRKYLLENTTIEEIIDLGAKAFENITAETIIIILKIEPPPEDHIILIKTPHHNQGFFMGKDSLVNYVQQNMFLKQENYNINLNLQYDELEIIDYIKMNKDCDLMKYFEAKTCIATGDDNNLLANYKVNDSYKKTIRGKNVGKFYIDFDDLFVHYDRRRLHRARDESIFLKPEKLVMQTISSNLTVAYDNKNYYPLSTCIAIIPKDNLNNNNIIKYLLSLMNSKLMNFYYDFVFNLGAHLTTEISVKNINLLPIKLPDNYEIFNILSNIMIQIHESVLSREKNSDLIEDFNNLFDLIIYMIVFKDKFILDGINADLVNLIYNEFIAIQDFSILNIKTRIKNIENNVAIKNELTKIMTHPWVTIIENYLK
ncbi:MAG: Eco57I restriction-modification methylase domain-containing protein [Candidatus Thorarchaeota archaeon]